MIDTVYAFELIDSLRIRAEIRQNAKDRKSVKEGNTDRLTKQLLEAAELIELLMYERSKLDIDDIPVYE